MFASGFFSLNEGQKKRLPSWKMLIIWVLGQPFPTKDVSFAL
jgi:hypothetical protein